MKPSHLPVLIVEDDAPMRRCLRHELEDLGLPVLEAECVEEARAVIEREDLALVVTDLVLPDGDGLDVLAAARASQPRAPVILLTGYGTVETAVSALKAGAVDFLEKPVEGHRLRAVVGEALSLSVGPRPAGIPGIVGDSPALLELMAKVAQLAATDTTVLIQGESGTGKELIARALHDGSPRRSRPFVALDCGALEPSLLASELFGHVRGAYTGAGTTRQGLIQTAHQGTLFLDEIGNLSPEVQARLLRVLQERRVRPLGGDGEREVDVRVIAASNTDLHSAVAAGTFRRDLYYRLAVVTLGVPPLRERLGDIPALVRHFADAVAQRLDRPTPSILPSALARLQEHSWPGNVRELANVVERAVILAAGDVVREFDLPPAAQPRPDVEPLDSTVRRAEEDAIRHALRIAPSKSQAARMLGISRRALYDKLDKLSIPLEAPRL